MLIQDVAEIRQYLGRAVNASFDPESLTPFIGMAQDQYIEKAFGSDYIAHLSGTTITTQESYLLKLIKRSLAFYAYYKYLPFSLGNDGDGGLQEIENTNSKPTRIGVLEKRQRASIENASDSLEAALSYLYANKTIFDVFFASPFGLANDKRWFRTANELSDILPFVGSSYRLLFTLQKYFDNAETDKVFDVIGAVPLSIVKAYHLTPTSNPINRALYDATRRYIALAGYLESLTFLQYHQSPEGIRVLSEFDGINNSKSPDSTQWAEYKRKIEIRTDAALNSLIAFMNTQIEVFPTFQTSPLYKPTMKGKRGPDNKKYKSIFRM